MVETSLLTMVSCIMSKHRSETEIPGKGFKFERSEFYLVMEQLSADDEGYFGLRGGQCCEF